MKSPRYAALTFLAASIFAVSSAHAQVTPQRLLDSAKEPQNWLTYSGDYSGHRFSTLNQINTSNAAALVPQWAYQTMAGGKFETTPLVVDGVLYATGQDDRAFALDAKTGRPIWQYQRALPADIRPCCGRVNRGVAILGDKVFFGTLDTHVIALDSKAGKVVTHGWREATNFTAEEVVHHMEPFCSGFLCTYVDKEGMLEGTDLDWFRRLRAATNHELTAAGGITTIDEIQQLHKLGIHAALGMAIYTGRLNLEELARLND